MPEEALDPTPLLRYLGEQGIEYVVIGGFAVVAHGFVRVTKDLDIVPRPTAQNLERLAGALRSLHATLLDVGDFTAAELPMDPTRAEDLAEGGNFCVTTSLGRLDVMQWTAGLESDDLYATLVPQALAANVDGVVIRVCGLEHLRAMKRAAGRPQDLEDLRQLDVD
jgi:hypothetical protein